MAKNDISFSEKATQDIKSIRYWYGEQRAGLGDEFFVEVLKVLSKVQKNPAAFRFIKNGVRRSMPARFPYYIYYSHKGGLTIMRIRHIKQKPLKRFT